jgi:Fe-S cluster assembly scaffold protein SufB
MGKKTTVKKGKKQFIVLQNKESAAHKIDVEDGAEAEILLVNCAPNDADVKLKIDAHVGKNAMLKLAIISVGGKETAYSLSINQKEGSRCEHYEACLLDGAQKMMARTNHFHPMPGSFSRSQFRYAAAGSAFMDVEGNVDIARKAKGADAHFVAKSLLLFRDARVRLVPKLSVKNGEVKAGHGAAMAPVSADELFYLESRGIDGRMGRQMILMGFLLEPLLSAKLDDKLTMQAEKCLMEKIGAIHGF